MRRRVAILAVLSTVVTLVGLGPAASLAGANTITRSIYPVDDSFTETYLCGFRIREHYEGTFQVIRYFDANGDEFKEVDLPYGGAFTVTFSAHGVAVTTRAQAFSLLTTYNPDGSIESATFRGEVFNFVIPGQGTVALDAGRYMFDSEGNLTFEAGHHQFLDGDLQELCQALSG
jgi:hypothetical protein